MHLEHYLRDKVWVDRWRGLSSPLIVEAGLVPWGKHPDRWRCPFQCKCPFPRLTSTWFSRKDFTPNLGFRLCYYDPVSVITAIALSVIIICPLYYLWFFDIDLDFVWSLTSPAFRAPSVPCQGLIWETKSWCCAYPVSKISNSQIHQGLCSFSVFCQFIWITLFFHNLVFLKLCVMGCYFNV